MRAILYAFYFLCGCIICQSQSNTITTTKVASYATLQNIEHWTDHLIENYLNNTHINFNALENYYHTLKEWSKSQFHYHHLPAMYFFSGADLYSLMALFPHAPGYGMIAEFSPGSIDCFENVTCVELATKRAYAWYEHVLPRNFGYSVTAYMRQYFEKQTGILPAFLLVLKILKEKVVHLETSDSGLKIITQTTIIVYESKYIKNKSDFDFCMNLEGMPPKPWGFLFKSGGVLHKLVNEPWFLGDLFSSGNLLIHDETGPALKAYQASNSTWSIRPYGHFHGFSGNKDLAHDDLVHYEELFKKHHPVPDIPFCFGYCAEFHTNGMLIVAEKENSVTQQQA